MGRGAFSRDRIEKFASYICIEFDVFVDGVDVLLSSSNPVCEHSPDGLSGEAGRRCHQNAPVDENKTLHSRWIPGRELDCHASTHGHSAHVHGVESESIYHGGQVGRVLTQ